MSRHLKGNDTVTTALAAKSLDVIVSVFEAMPPTSTPLIVLIRKLKRTPCRGLSKRTS